MRTMVSAAAFAVAMGVCPSASATVGGSHEIRADKSAYCGSDDADIGAIGDSQRPGNLACRRIRIAPAETTAVYVGHTTRYDAPDAVVRNTWRAGKALAVWGGKEWSRFSSGRDLDRFWKPVFAMTNRARV